jgi:uncharacterized protein
VPCGDAAAIAAAAGPPGVGGCWSVTLAAGHALLARRRRPGRLIVHDQRFMVVEASRADSRRGAMPDPGLRRAEPATSTGSPTWRCGCTSTTSSGPTRDWPAGAATGSGCRPRSARGLVWCVGPVGAPDCKVERSVSSVRWGVQLAGIVVDPAARHRKLGRGAVAAAVRQALASQPDATISLHVRSDNERAISAYRAAGFVDREPWVLAVRP